jgi:hypothetical protein
MLRNIVVFIHLMKQCKNLSIVQSSYQVRLTRDDGRNVLSLRRIVEALADNKLNVVIRFDNDRPVFR